MIKLLHLTYQMKRMKLVSIKSCRNAQPSLAVDRISTSYKTKILWVQVEVVRNSRALMQIDRLHWSKNTQSKRKTSKIWNKQVAGVVNSSIKNFIRMKVKTIYWRIQKSSTRMMKRIKPHTLRLVRLNGERQQISRSVLLKSWGKKNCRGKIILTQSILQMALETDIDRVCRSKQSQWCQCSRASWTAARSAWSN